MSPWNGIPRGIASNKKTIYSKLTTIITQNLPQVGRVGHQVCTEKNTKTKKNVKLWFCDSNIANLTFDILMQWEWF